MGPDLLIVGHWSGYLARAPRFTRGAHDIIGAAEGSHVCRRTASPAIDITAMMTRVAQAIWSPLTHAGSRSVATLMPDPHLARTEVMAGTRR